MCKCTGSSTVRSETATKGNEEALAAKEATGAENDVVEQQRVSVKQHGVAWLGLASTAGCRAGDATSRAAAAERLADEASASKAAGGAECVPSHILFPHALLISGPQRVTQLEHFAGRLFLIRMPPSFLLSGNLRFSSRSRFHSLVMHWWK
ncbi:hypothetical protein ERJ75_000443900 [Trypanosoma vivax]|nr:hypothetical protein ERJ75_000443900 [Trypanosoma vivax]